jgi:eukaryotic-like serine/threonine-protein kinase
MAKRKVNQDNDGNGSKAKNPCSPKFKAANSRSRFRKFNFRRFRVIGLIVGAIALILLAYLAIINFGREERLNSQIYLDFLRNSAEYSNKNFKLKYPKGWQVNRYTPNEFSQIVAEFSPANRYSLEEIQPKIFIEVRNFKKSLSLKEIRQATAREIKAFLPNSNIFEKKEIELDSQPAYLLVYTGLEGENKLQKMQIGTIKDEHLYILTYEAKRDRYEEYQPTVQAMIDSFEFTQKQ